MSLTKLLTSAYAIATGSCNFASMKAKGYTVIVAELSDISAEDNKLKLQQSIDESCWADVPSSEQTLQPAQTSHSWNISGYPRGMYFRVVLTAGTAEAGSVDQIKMLSDE